MRRFHMLCQGNTLYKLAQTGDELSRMHQQADVNVKAAHSAALQSEAQEPRNRKENEILFQKLRNCSIRIDLLNSSRKSFKSLIINKDFFMSYLSTEHSPKYPSNKQDLTNTNHENWKIVAKSSLEKAKIIGKGILIEGAKPLSEMYWIEAIDKHHRYGNDLQPHFQAWKLSDSTSNFFEWLDNASLISETKDCDLTPYKNVWKELQHSIAFEDWLNSIKKIRCVRYFGKEELWKFKLIFGKDGLIYQEKEKGSLVPVSTEKEPIFVVDTNKDFYLGEYERGVLHHSSFVNGGAVLGCGIMHISNGRLVSITDKCGHYHYKKGLIKELFIFHTLKALNQEKIPLDDVEVILNVHEGSEYNPIKYSASHYLQQSLSSHSWYKGQIKKTEAERVLKETKKVGSFLVRQVEKKEGIENPYEALLLKENHCAVLPIFLKNNQFSFGEGSSFAKLEDLIKKRFSE